MVVAVLFISLIVLMMISVPIAASIGFATMAALVANESQTLFVVVQRMFTGLDSTVLLAIPMFIFAGMVMAHGGISNRIIDLSYQAFGFVPGSLAIVTVVSCMFFAALSGSAPATVAAIGGIMVPAMIKDGYPPGFAAAITAASGVIGCIIPPSIPFVNYGLITGASVGELFMGGMVPGILMGVSLCVVCSIQAVRNKWGSGTVKFNFKNFWVALKRSILALLMPVIILGGIYGGVFTPTESASVACVYGLFVAVIVYRSLKVTKILDVAYQAALTTAMILFIVGVANSFSWVVTTQQVPALLAELVTSITDSRVVVLLLINLLLLINGCFMEETATTFIYTPILLPLAVSVGVDPVHFGVIMVMNMTMGLITPPLGINLFVANSLDKRSDFGSTVRYVMPLFITELVILMLVTYVPAVSMTLVELLRS